MRSIEVPFDVVRGHPDRVCDLPGAVIPLTGENKRLPGLGAFMDATGQSHLPHGIENATVAAQLRAQRSHEPAEQVLANGPFQYLHISRMRRSLDNGCRSAVVRFPI